MRTIAIIASYDMGWNQRATGRIYDSLSGHGFLIGCRSGKVIALGVRSKKCAKCTAANKRNTTVQPHFCTVNHEGPSGSMEAKMALDLTVDLHAKFNGRIHLGKIVSDDDSTMRSLLKHKAVHPKGKLPCDVPQPVFLADPSHRIKVMAKPFFKMVVKSKDPTQPKQKQ